MGLMNDRLRDLYETYWDSYLEHIRFNPDLTAAFPFLIFVPKEYEAADFKVMFCGEETQGWGGEFEDKPNVTVRNLQRIYNGFVNGNGYNSPYWNFQRRIISNHSHCGYIRNNIVKIGKKRQAGCDENIDRLTRKYFPVFKRELEILRPDLIIFLSGTGVYDWKIKLALGAFKKISMSDKFTFERLEFADPEIPHAIRLNHPAWLQRKRLYWPAINRLNRYMSDMLIDGKYNGSVTQ